MDPKCLSYNLPPDYFELILKLYPIQEITDNEWLYFMYWLEKGYWYIVDNIVQRPLDYGKFIRDFIHDYKYRMTDRLSTIVHTSWIHNWNIWKQSCVISGIAVVVKNDSKWYVLMVKNRNLNFNHLSVTWPAGKPEINDKTLWQQACREFYEELGIDLYYCHEEVTHVLTNIRAVSFVLVLDKDDPKIKDIKIDTREIHSYTWLPIDYKDIRVIKSQEGPGQIDDGCIYMSWLPAKGFKKLGNIKNITERQPYVEYYQNLDPWTLEKGNIKQVPL